MSDKTPEYPGYQLIPFDKITDEARRIAVAWCNGFEPSFGTQIEQRHKLASDIMNYANAQLKSRDELLERANEIIDDLRKFPLEEITHKFQFPHVWERLIKKVEDYTKIKKP